MADVVMTDIPAPAKRAAGKAKAGGAEGGADGKKRFEVKKVRAFYASYGEAAKALTI
jgi:RING-box protein 1